MSFEADHTLSQNSYEQSNLRILNLMVGILEETSALLDEIEQKVAKQVMTQPERLQHIMSISHKVTEYKRRAQHYGALQGSKTVSPGLEQINNLFTRIDIQLLAHQDVLNA